MPQMMVVAKSKKPTVVAGAKVKQQKVIVPAPKAKKQAVVVVAKAKKQTVVEKEVLVAKVAPVVAAETEVELTDVENVRAKIAEFEAQVSKIKYGKRWKDDQTAEAVRKLEKLNFLYIMGLILAIEDVDDQWKLALEYTLVIGNVVQTATVRAHKRVNGEWGQFCQIASQIITTGLWRELCEKEGRPNDELFDNVVQQIFLDKIFLEYVDLSFVSEG